MCSVRSVVQKPVSSRPNAIMTSPEIAEIPFRSAQAAMATVMARILAGTGTDTHRHTRRKREEREAQTWTKRRKLQKDILEPNSHSRFQDGDTDLSSGSECYDIIGHMTGQSASDPGPVDVVKQCHKLLMEWSLEDEGVFHKRRSVDAD